MEGSAAAAGAAQGDAGQAQGDAQAQSGPDFGALTQTLDAVRQEVGGLSEFVRSEPWQQAQEAVQEAAPPEFDLSWLDPADPAFDPQQLQTSLQEQIDRAAEAKLTPLQAQLQEMQDRLANDEYQRKAQALAAENEQWLDSGYATEMMRMSGEYIDGELAYLPDELRSRVANDPAILRLIAGTHAAAQAANAEGGAQSAPAAHLEGGGPAPGGSEVDPADQIFGAAKGGRSVLPF